MAFDMPSGERHARRGMLTPLIIVPPPRQRYALPARARYDARYRLRTAPLSDIRRFARRATARHVAFFIVSFSTLIFAMKKERQTEMLLIRDIACFT